MLHLRNISFFLFCLFCCFALSACAPQPGSNHSYVELTPQERQFVAKHQTIRVGSNNMPPYIYEEDGKIRGYAVDLLTFLGQKAGLEMEFVICRDYQAIECLKNGQIDLIPNIIVTPEQSEFILFSHCQYALDEVIFGRSDRKDMPDLASLEDKTVALPPDYAVAGLLKQHYPRIKIIETKDLLSSLQDVSAGKADATVMTSYMGQYILSDKFITKLDAVGTARIDNQPPLTAAHYGVRKDLPLLQSILDKAFQTLSPADRQEIWARWFHKPERDMTPLVFSEPEKNYLAQKKTIKYIYNPDWKPLDYASEGNHAGIISGYMKLLEKRLGVKFQAVPAKNKNEAVSKLISGECDFLSGEVPLPKNKSHLAYTDPYFKTTIVFLGKSDKSLIYSVDSLLDKSVGVSSTSCIKDVLKKDYPSFRLIEAANCKEALQNLEDEEIYALATTLEHSAQILSEHPDHFKVICNSNINYPLSMAVRQNNPQLHSLLQKAVESIRAEDRDEIATKWTSVTIAQYFDYSLIWKTLGILGFFAIFLIFRGYELAKLNRKLWEANRASELARQEAVAANKSKSDFLARMSHEIRTPLNAVIGLSELLTFSDLTPKQREQLNKIQYSANLLLGVINDVLDLSKIEAGRMDLEKTVFNLKDVVASVYNVLEIRAKENRLRLTYVIDPTIPAFLVGDPVKIGQVLLNLGTNAIKFTEQGMVEIKLSAFNHSAETVTVNFRITDTGMGVDQADLDKLFQPFTQADESISRKYGGSGLGLTISRQLVELMGGSLQGKSQTAIGSTFHFTITLGIAPDIPRLFASYQGGKTPFATLPGYSVLVVEDNELNREVISGLLENIGIVVSTANNGLEAINQIQKKRFDAILMDIQMPIMDGIEATKTIRDAGFSMPVIGLSANAVSEEVTLSLAAGMNDYLTKPFRLTDLHKLLIKWLPGSTGSDNAAAGEIVLEHLNIRNGQQYFDNRTEYLDALRAFANKNRSTVWTMIKQLDQGENGPLLENLHVIKANAGYIGADHLFTLTAKLETEILNGEPPASTFAQFKAALEGALADIEKLLVQPDKRRL